MLCVLFVFSFPILLFFNEKRKRHVRWDVAVDRIWSRAPMLGKKKIYSLRLKQTDNEFLFFVFLCDKPTIINWRLVLYFHCFVQKTKIKIKNPPPNLLKVIYSIESSTTTNFSWLVRIFNFFLRSIIKISNHASILKKKFFQTPLHPLFYTYS